LRTISRMTTTYNAQEDRLRLSAIESGDGQRLVLWLTQRASRSIIAYLLDQLEHSVAADAPPAARPAVQLMEQAKAEMQRKPLPKLPPSEVREEHLVTNVRIRRAEKQIALIFAWGEVEDDCIALAIDRTRVRQWLRIFHGHYKRARWPLDIWPQWFEEDAPAKILGREHLH
jgi:hypothetical protein